MIKKYYFRKTTVVFSIIAALLLIAPGAIAAGRMLVPLGYTVGISLDTNGVVVVGYSEETDSPAKAAGILPGDIITELDGKSISSSEDIMDCSIGTGTVSITVSRNGELKTLSVTPLINSDGTAELGLWLRDNLSGIGTVTYYDPETGEFGALGHPVNDVDTGVMVPVRAGQISQATITNIIQGKCGSPGQLVGVFDLSSVCGEVNGNTPCGIFGTITDSTLFKNGAALEVADKGAVSTGPAEIIASLENEAPKSYSVEIVRIDSDNHDGRCLMLKVTDEELIGKTGGIVQGMSGSPIVQDGKLVGAVTHVLVNDPTRGYGIFAETMLSEAEKVVNNKAA